MSVTHIPVARFYFKSQKTKNPVPTQGLNYFYHLCIQERKKGGEKVDGYLSKRAIALSTREKVGPDNAYTVYRRSEDGNFLADRTVTFGKVSSIWLEKEDGSRVRLTSSEAKQGIDAFLAKHLPDPAKQLEKRESLLDLEALAGGLPDNVDPSDVQPDTVGRKAAEHAVKVLDAVKQRDDGEAPSTPKKTSVKVDTEEMTRQLEEAEKRRAERKAQEEQDALEKEEASSSSSPSSADAVEKRKASSSTKEEEKTKEGKAPTSSSSTPGSSGADEKKTENKTNWLRLVIGAGLVVGVGISVYLKRDELGIDFSHIKNKWQQLVG